MWEGRDVYGFGLAVVNVIPFAKLLVFDYLQVNLHPFWQLVAWLKLN